MIGCVVVRGRSVYFAGHVFYFTLVSLQLGHLLGMLTWHSFSCDCQKHEKAKSHMEAYKQWKVFDRGTHESVDVMFSRARREATVAHKGSRQNRYILRQNCYSCGKIAILTAKLLFLRQNRAIKQRQNPDKQSRQNRDKKPRQNRDKNHGNTEIN